MVAETALGCRLKLFAALALMALQAAGATYYVTIAGLGGIPDYQMQFDKWSADLDHTLRANGPDAHVTTLSGAAATRGRVEELLGQLAREVKPEDAFALLMIGHGTFDGTDYKFNLPGPDITATELADALNRISAHRQLVVNMTSCSGASLAALAKKGRIVITATKSGTEKNAPVFARYWLDALRDSAADTDKNGTVSALEAFNYVQKRVAAYFESEKLLATEHAVFTDNGSANAVRDPKPDNGQGLLAGAFPMLRPEAESARAVSPDKQRLIAKKEDLEAKIDRLKYEKAAMPPEEYRQQLTALLLELARTQAELDR